MREFSVDITPNAECRQLEAKGVPRVAVVLHCVLARVPTASYKAARHADPQCFFHTTDTAGQLVVSVVVRCDENSGVICVVLLPVPLNNAANNTGTGIRPGTQQTLSGTRYSGSGVAGGQVGRWTKFGAQVVAIALRQQSQAKGINAVQTNGTSWNVDASFRCNALVVIAFDCSSSVC